MTILERLLIGLAVLAVALLIAGSIPWTSRTVVDIRVVDESDSPIPGAEVRMVSAQGGILAEGTTDGRGVLALKYSPDPDTDWGKRVWRLEFFVDGYVTNEAPLKMSETRHGTVWAWLPGAGRGREKPHLLFLIQTKVVCRKVS